MIHMNKVSFSYNNHNEEAIENIHLHIKKGECILLCGESGCGKSTITKMINGLIPHFEKGEKKGEVWINQNKIDDLPIYKISTIVSSVFQNPKSQFFNLDVDSEIAFALENQGLSLEAIEKRLSNTVKELAIEHLLDRSMFALSGGEKQIISVACAYAADPQILVLDEPSANLDAETIKRLADILNKLKAEGKTIIIAEHRLAFLRQVADRVLYIKNHQIESVFESEQFYRLSNPRRKQMGLRQLYKETGDQTLTSDQKTIDQCNKLTVENLSLTYSKKTILENISFTAQSGDVIALIGANGTGKSTLCNCICGFKKQAKGSVALNGHNLPVKKRLLSSYVVMQDVNHQLFGESVYDECKMGNTGTKSEDIDYILGKMELLAFKDVHPQSLSGGQKQRLAVAGAYLANKKVVVLDEPTSGLDYAGMVKVSELVHDMAKRGSIILIITHDAEFIENTCSRCLNLNKNNMQEISKLSDILIKMGDEI